MLAPKRVKYRYSFRGRRSGLATRGTNMEFGEYGLKSLEAAWVSARQIEAARRAISHHTKRGGRIWIRIFPDKPITKKPPEVRMGSGKGAIDHYAAVVKPGMVLFELGGVPEKVAIESMKLAAMKLPVDVKIVHRGEN
jgi:large subunit ribosomal protein L16